MTVEPPRAAMTAALLDLEWVRLGLMLTLAEAMRTGDALPEAHATRFRAVDEAVEAARPQGAWAGLAAAAGPDVLAALTRLDLDLMVVALAPLARPALAPRLQSLQPQAGTPWPTVALLQEVLMLDEPAEVAALFERLSPGAPLVGAGLVRVEGAAPYAAIRPGGLLVRALLGRDAELAPPPGATLTPARGAWDDLVLPPAAMAQVRDFAAWVHRADMLVRDWGARRLHGPLALFAGASGTGKSFAASVIAGHLAARTGEPWALYALDLGRIMSKYVGETEANINALLDSLDGRRAILQIDEADGLLGKRGEVSDARDRYANLEVSHMLGRFEAHCGPVILTTNLRANVDSAFLRRFQLVVDFPAPDAAARARLWDRLLPPRAPRAPGLDLVAVAGAARLSGGAIRNAATYAAVLAAEEGRAIGPAHVARAVWAELGKDGRQVRRAEIGCLAEHLPEAA
jgi:hypothetical protein